MKNKKYFHELSKEEYHELAKSGMTYKELAKKHPQPKWCKYSGATDGVLGCWSLVGFRIKGKEDCGECEHSE